MTDSKEVIAYIIAHVAGYVVGAVVSQLVLWPMMIASGVIESTIARYVVAFLFAVFIQLGVFFLFLAVRGRRAPG